MADLGSGRILSRTIEMDIVGLDIPVNKQLQVAEVERALQPGRYPSIAGWQLPQPGIARDQSGLPVLRLLWEISGRSFPDSDRRVAEIADEYRCINERWLVPAVGQGNDPLAPLMAWWGVLYALSMFARYEPITWQTCLTLTARTSASHWRLASTSL